MRQLKYIHAVLAVLASWALVSCTIDERYPVVGERESVVTFTPVLSGDMQTRAIGEATKINQLVVCVFEGPTQVLRQDLTWSQVSGGVSLTLIEGRTYDILFWAQCKDNTAYTLSDAGQIQVNYTDYLAGGFARMEELDAFYATSSVTVGSTAVENKGAITLTRPLAQVNFADNATQPVQGSHRTQVTYADYPTAFDPFSKTVTATTEDLTFIFEDYPTETLSAQGKTYYYVATNYFFAPYTISNATLDFQDNQGTSLKNIVVDDLLMEPNKKTNVIGSIVQEPVTWSVWDGTTKTEPAVDAQNCYVIDAASDLAWLADNGLQLPERTKFLQKKDIDMNNESISSIKLPDGSTYDGGGKRIKNFANSLFGDATSLTVKDLAVENITASGSTHIGTLVNTLKGSSSFENVTVTSSSATTTSGAAGGMVGYIVRTTEKDRDETLNVSFTGCKLNGVTVSGSASEGKFVGLLSGYDNYESLSFDAECTATDVKVADYTSAYIKANNSAWVTNDVTDKYDGWLGAETYRRAKVTFAGVRLAPRWDGITATVKADLLLYNGEANKYEVHSPFDLAGVRNATASPATLYLMENVDMYGQGADGKYNVPSNWTQSANGSEDDNYFKSFSSITYLDGNEYGIYNLSINTQKVSTSLYYGGFIQSTSGTTTHKNISFHNSCVVVPLVVASNEDKGSAGMLVSNIAGTNYTMKNVHTDGCKIFALQKVGGLAARVAATNSTITNCSVNNCYIENYQCKDHNENFSKSAASVTVSASFYSYGEIGGMFGFVEQNATLDECSVTNTTIYAYGQDDVNATLSGNRFLVAIAQGLGLYKVPGRHVGTFIGDVRTTADGGGTITMTNISVDDDTKCTNRWDKHNNKCETVGLAYYLNYSDDEGTVNYNGTKLTLMNCSTKQNNRNQ